MLELLKKISYELEARNIPYMVSGSMALNTYAIARTTVDIDIVIELTEQNLEAFETIFKDNYYINHTTVKEEIQRHGMFNVINQLNGFKLDFIIRKETPYRKLEFERRIRKVITDFEVWMVSPEDLVISKLEWIQVIYSDRQINDINNLLSIAGIDKEYIIEWSKKLNLNTYNLW